MPLPETIEIPVKTLSPIWTGDADMKTSYIKGSSVMGGLRFWMEALLRFCGEHVCDITNKSNNRKCVYDPEKEKQKRGKRRDFSNAEQHEIPCACCKVFGCTGMGRSFALRIHDKTKPERHIGLEYYSSSNNETPTGRKGDLTIQLIPIRSVEENQKIEIDHRLILTLALMTKYGAIGAKDQYGLGLVKPNLEGLTLDLDAMKIPTKPFSSIKNTNFGDFFFYTGKALNANEKELINIRANVRRKINEELKNMVGLHYFCGSIQKPKFATKYNIGITNDNKVIRGWGWFPESDQQFGHNRNNCLDILKKEIEHHTEKDSLVWREFNSSRDSLGASSSPLHYVKSLFEGDWS